MTITYALLKDRDEAQHALDELQAMAERWPSLRIHVYDHGPHLDELALHETGAIKGLTNGAIFGALGAAVLVIAMSLLGVMSGGTILAAALAAVGLGAFYGGLVGFVAGASAPDLNLSKLEHQMDADDLLVSVACNRPHAFTEANAVLRRHGAIEAHPQLI